MRLQSSSASRRRAVLPKRIVEPEDVAEAVLACVTLKASPGGRIVVEGGRFLA